MEKWFSHMVIFVALNTTVSLGYTVYFLFLGDSVAASGATLSSITCIFISYAVNTAPKGLKFGIKSQIWKPG